MKLIITTNDCLISNGYYDTIMTAFGFANPWATGIVVRNRRIEAKRGGYLIRFSIDGFSIKQYRDLMYSEDKVHTCILTPLPVLPQKTESNEPNT